MAVNFPDSPTNGATTVINGATYTWDGVKWDTTSIASNIIATYDSPLNLPITGLTNGDVAWVGGSTNKLYISNGTGWLSATLTNSAPVINSVQDASASTTPFSLATDGTPTVITVDATDPESFGLTYTYSVTSGALGTTATVSQADNVFTITPSTSEANAGTFELTFSVYDGVNTVTSVAEFSLSFLSDFDRAIFTGGTTGSGGSTPIEYVSISTGSNTATFGTLQTQRGYHTTTGNKDRAISSNGETTGANVYTDSMEYVVPATLGNGITFGTNAPSRADVMSASSDTRAVFAGGGAFSGSWSWYYNMYYVTIATTSNTSSFGTLNTLNWAGSGGSNAGEYAFFGGGAPNGGSFVSTIERVAIATTGNSSAFGNLSATGGAHAVVGDQNYVVWGGGGTWSGDRIDVLTAATGGTATNVGSLSAARYSLAGSDDRTTGLFAGGYGTQHYSTIDQITIASASNSTNFGNLLTARYRLSGTSGSPA